MDTPQFNISDLDLIDKALTEYGNDLHKLTSTCNSYLEIGRVNQVLKKIRELKSLSKNRKVLES